MNKPLIIPGAVVPKGGKMDLGLCGACVVSAVYVDAGGCLKSGKGNFLYDIKVDGMMSITGGYVRRLAILSGLVQAGADAHINTVDVSAQLSFGGNPTVNNVTVNSGGRVVVGDSTTLTDVNVCNDGVIELLDAASVTRLTISSGAEVHAFGEAFLYNVWVLSGGSLMCRDKSKVDELCLESGGKFRCLDKSEVIYTAHSPQKILWDNGEQLVPPVSSAAQSNVVTLKLPKSALQAGTMTVRLEVEDA